MSLAEVLRRHLCFDPVATVQEKPFDLVQYLETLEDEETIFPPTPESVYRVSHVIQLCPRQEVLKHKFKIVKKRKISAKLRRTFDFGENYHRMMQNKILANSGYLVGDWICVRCLHTHFDMLRPQKCATCATDSFEYQELTPKSQEYGISAHVDGVLLNNGKKKILELKTVNAINFRLITEINKRPHDSHVKQINMYMWLTGIHQGVILYFDKNESQLYQSEQSLNHSYIKEVLSDLREAREGMKTGIVPDKKVCESSTCTRAKACPVSKICFSEP